MENLIHEVTEQVINSLMAQSCGEFQQADEVWRKDKKDLEDLEQRYLALDLSDHQRQIINDHLACFDSLKNREKELAYLAGLRDGAKME